MAETHNRVIDAECVCEDGYLAKGIEPVELRRGVWTLHFKLTMAILGILSLATLIFQILQNTHSVTSKASQVIDTTVHTEQESTLNMFSIILDILNTTYLNNH